MANCGACGDKLPGEATVHECWLVKQYGNLDALPEEAPTEYLTVGNLPDDIIAEIKLPHRSDYGGWGG